MTDKASPPGDFLMKFVVIGGTALVILTAAFLLSNGLFMLIAPMKWYYVVPGVTETGFYNQHFIRDIGLVYLFLGAAVGIGLFRANLRLALWATAAAWLSAHALFHFWEVAVGLCAPSAIPRDFPAVTMPPLISIAAILWAWRMRQPRQGVPQSIVHPRKKAAI
jgi:hypothetical protein